MLARRLPINTKTKLDLTKAYLRISQSLNSDTKIQIKKESSKSFCRFLEF